MTLAVSTAGFLALGPGAPSAHKNFSYAAVADCSHQSGGSSIRPENCITAPAQPAGASTQNLVAFAEKLLAGTDVSPAGDTQTGAGQPAAGAATTSNDLPEALSPRAGYTVAELCARAPDVDGFRCEVRPAAAWQGAARAASRADGQTDSRIAGHLLTADGNGLGGVSIIATPERLKAAQAANPGRWRFRTVTDSLGAYALDGLPAGEYTIRSAAQGSYPAARISARTGVTYADLVVAQNITRIAEGRVLADTGEPLEGVTVLPVLLGQPSVMTDADGRFSMQVSAKPAVDAFALRFQRPGYHEQGAEVVFPPHQAAQLNALDVVMHPVETWTAVNGQVASESGPALAGRRVELRPRAARQSYRTTTDAEGFYSFPMVEAPADYRLVVSAGPDHEDHQQALHVTADMDDVDVIAKAYDFGAVTGRLVNLNGEPIPSFELVLRNAASHQPNAVVQTDGAGDFKVQDVPAGELVVASQSSPSILIRGLYLEPGGSLHLPLVVDWGEHEIRGLVLDARGNPVPASRVVLQWSHRAEGITTLATRRTAADTQGQFAFANLGPGPHSLQVQAPGFAAVAIDHDVDRQGYDLTVRLN